VKFVFPNAAKTTEQRTVLFIDRDYSNICFLAKSLRWKSDVWKEIGRIS